MKYKIKILNGFFGRLFFQIYLNRIYNQTNEKLDNIKFLLKIKTKRSAKNVKIIIPLGSQAK